MIINVFETINKSTVPLANKIEEIQTISDYINSSPPSLIT